MKKIVIILMASFLFALTALTINAFSKKTPSSQSKAKIATTTSVVITPHVWQPGCSETYKVYGYLRKRGRGIANKRIYLYRSLNNKTWSYIGTLRTSSRGYFSKKVAIHDVDTAYYKALFKGDIRLKRSSGKGHTHKGNNSCD